MPDSEVKLGRAGRATLFVASIALVLMMLVVVFDVVLRFVFNTPLRGAYDLVSAFLLIMVFFGMGPVIALGREILIDLIDEVAPAGMLRISRLVAAFGTLIVTVFIGWSMVTPAQDAYGYGDRSLELGLPVWILWLVAFVGLAGVIFAALDTLLTTLRLNTTCDTISGDDR